MTVLVCIDVIVDEEVEVVVSTIVEVVLLVYVTVLKFSPETDIAAAITIAATTITRAKREYGLVILRAR
jgi:hypothetical protein